MIHLILFLRVHTATSINKQVCTEEEDVLIDVEDPSGESVEFIDGEEVSEDPGSHKPTGFTSSTGLFTTQFMVQVLPRVMRLLPPVVLHFKCWMYRTIRNWLQCLTHT